MINYNYYNYWDINTAGNQSIEYEGVSTQVLVGACFYAISLLLCGINLVLVESLHTSRIYQPGIHCIASYPGLIPAFSTHARKNGKAWLILVTQ